MHAPARPTPPARLATFYQRESADDSRRARFWRDSADPVAAAAAIRNQRFAAATAAKARQLQGIES